MCVRRRIITLLWLNCLPPGSAPNQTFKAITAGLSGSASARLDSRYARRAMLALISTPIWLIIVLLSPLDAYATARTVVRQQ